MNDEKYVLLCEHCSKDIGITTEELSTAIMLPKPLTAREIRELLTLDECWNGEDSSMPNLLGFARAIEKKHGIL